MSKIARIIATAVVSILSASSHAGNNNPSSVGYVQEQIANVMTQVQSQLGDLSTNVRSYVQTQISTIPVVSTYTVGQQALGGTVFYVDSSGEHGLVAASSANGIATGQTWDGGISNFTTYNTDIFTNATGNGIGAGAINTSLMVSVQSSYVASQGFNNDGSQTTLSNMAAQICVNFSVQADGQTPCSSNTIGASCYADWYLPSLYELNQMYLQKSTLNYPLVTDQDAFIWSSTEADQNDAWRINFTASSGQQESLAGKSDMSGVWCIRAF